MNEKSGNLLGGILLVAGCCIGAGMLGLPLLSALAGFQPSVLMFIICWIFMACTGLLLLEVNLWYGKEINLITMTRNTLGKTGEYIAWGLFLFLFYSLMVAYASACGDLFADFYQQITGIVIPGWVGNVVCTSIFASCVYLGTRSVDGINRFLMLGLILSYIILVILGIYHIDPENLQHRDWSATTLVIPAMIISFGYHNLIPSLTTYFNSDVRRLRLTLIIGSLLPLIIYLIWETIILGIIPLEGEGGFRQTLSEGDMVTQALKGAIGTAWIVDVVRYFSFFAIVTSYIPVSLSLVDFLADGLQIKKTSSGKLLLCGLAFLPPFIFAIIYPKIFVSALNYAGSFGAVILFGILPALMVWKGRYHLRLERQRILPGGKPVLVLILLFSLMVVVLQIIHEINHFYIN